MSKRWSILAWILLFGAFLMIDRAPNTVAAVQSPTPLVVIDPGHGGWDPGAVRGSVYEKRITLDVGLKLGTLLQQRGYRVYYTRQNDRALSNTVMRDLTQRAVLANNLGAALFVTVHVNSEPTGSMAGPIVYYNPVSPSSYQLARAVSKSLAPAVGLVHAPRPIRQWVLRVARMPAINVEIGFITHRTDARRLQQAWYQNLLAQSIANGISRYDSATALALMRPALLLALANPFDPWS
ncbi:N-acetylmuramoyl-L-alanine amidase family protein [Sulfobacillus harzensis]|uniref:N-acetylmuramoyl-L-alanine amidase family protein n=1 Tax=Sulfobacillus harzensis TaxID=2729629 RepID=UPI001FACF2E2|nr:N-acetylmuramoyl-L-alanine amidase [Sulfobacillus harzensis]